LQSDCVRKLGTTGNISNSKLNPTPPLCHFSAEINAGLDLRIRILHGFRNMPVSRLRKKFGLR
jgi:hypothetical protein